MLTRKPPVLVALAVLTTTIAFGACSSGGSSAPARLEMGEPDVADLDPSLQDPDYADGAHPTPPGAAKPEPKPEAKLDTDVYREQMKRAQAGWQPEATRAREDLESGERDFDDLRAKSTPDLIACAAGADGKSCPAGIAGLQIGAQQTNGSWSAAAGLNCTGTLIAPDLMITAAHCIPAQIASPGADCHGIITAFFPAHGAEPAVVAECRQVIGLSPRKTAPIGADFALIQLSHAVARTPVEISREGILPGRPYFAMIHSEVGIRWDLAPVACRPSFASTLAPQFTDAQNLVAHFSDCPIGPGDSGMAILDDQGRLVSVAGGQLNPRYVEQLSAALRFQGLISQPLGYRGWATNLACIPMPGAAQAELPAACDLSVDPQGLVAVDRKAQAALTSAFDDWRRSGAPSFGWALFRDLSQPLLQGEFIAVPSCLTPGSKPGELVSRRWSFGYGSGMELRTEIVRDFDQKIRVELTGKVAKVYRVMEIKPEASPGKPDQIQEKPLYERELEACPK